MLRQLRNFSTARVFLAAPRTGVLMMNMGGPQTLGEVEGFLTKLFADKDIIDMPLQRFLGPMIARRRTPKVQKKYEEIGGGSPIYKYTQKQGDLMVELLDSMSPSSAPHKAYVGFRYASPFSSDALDQIKKDGVKRVVAFSQYPQYSCCTTGSSLNQLQREVNGDPELSDVQWSFIDRWSLNEGLIDAFVESIENEAKKIPKEQLDELVLVFTAHSLPLKIVARGDTYPSEVGATVLAVMKKLKHRYPHRLVWQSKVGPVPWLAPKTDEAIKGFASRGRNTLMMVPISFVNEHIETLHELDIEYGDDLAKELKLEKIYRAEAPNFNKHFIRGLADEVKNHLDSNIRVSPQLGMRCPHCVNPECIKLRHWLRKC
ncbi:ferrochelatase, mitochondrial [Galendromus occidentalis]|uniref:Ferrochelatase n=1 Tax=Galendromus occidentalis TaxID=34638 RepID=A0AAJ6QWY7_9ACAR|nr:ferrochelatase, mitochondrial [Galendromus occidentalis]